MTKDLRETALPGRRRLLGAFAVAGSVPARASAGWLTTGRPGAPGSGPAGPAGPAESAGLVLRERWLLQRSDR